MTGPVRLRYNQLYRLSVGGERAGKRTLRLQADSIDVALPERLATEMLPYLVSDRYWRQRYCTLQEWAYIGMDNGTLLGVDTTDHRYGQFVPLVWLGYRYQPSTEWPVVFSVRTNTPERQTLTLAALQRLAEWGAFTTVEGLQAYEERMALRRQQEEEQQLQLQQQLDSLDRVSELYGRQADSITVVLQRDFGGVFHLVHPVRKDPFFFRKVNPELYSLEIQLRQFPDNLLLRIREGRQVRRNAVVEIGKKRIGIRKQGMDLIQLGIQFPQAFGTLYGSHPCRLSCAVHLRRTLLGRPRPHQIHACHLRHLPLYRRQSQELLRLRADNEAHPQPIDPL